MSYWKRTIIVLLAATLAMRVVTMIWMNLIPEEAYYWMYSQHPSMSYFDHPPMVAWLIGLGTLLFGNTLFGVRIAIGLLMLASSGAMYAFSRMWFGREASMAAALLLQVLPVYFGAGLIATMDAALVFFWLIALVGLSVALRKQCTWGWYLAGVGAGGAMLSKYTGVFLELGALATVIGYRPWRRYLTTPHPYAAVLLSFAMFIPVLIWNAQHQWASFRFQFVDRFEGNAFSVAHVMLFVLMQIATATPVVLAGLGWLFARILRKKRRLSTPRWLLVLSFSLPLLLAMSYQSLRTDVHLNWTLPAYLSALPAIAQLTLARRRQTRNRLSTVVWRRAALITVVACLILNLLAMIYVLILQPRVGWLAALGPWPELATAVQKIADRNQAETGRESLIVGADKNRLASVLAFYRTPLEKDVRASDFTTSQWVISGEGLAYPYWANADLWSDCNVIIVDDRNATGRFASRLEKYNLLDDIRLNRKSYQIAVGRFQRN
ncbi:MAG: glycosyltransferase family 39 protein [Methylococcales bacterium]